MRPIRFWCGVILSTAVLVGYMVASGWAESKVIYAEYTYTMGGGETEMDAETNAILQAKRLAVEQAGTYIESFSEVQNGQLSQDDILALAAGILATEVDAKQLSVDGNAFKIYVRIKATVDTANLQEKMHDRQALEENKALQAKITELLAENEQLKAQLAAAGQNDRDSLASARQDVQNKLTAAQWFEIGNQKQDSGDHDGAIEAYSKAIELDPRYSDAYNNRGIVYYATGQLDLALNDYNQALPSLPGMLMYTTTGGWSIRTRGNLTWPWRTTARRWRLIRTMTALI